MQFKNKINIHIYAEHLPINVLTYLMQTWLLQSNRDVVCGIDATIEFDELYINILPKNVSNL